jgi:outer membrane protein OmpA-like peptidoglycan-associated protein
MRSLVKLAAMLAAVAAASPVASGPVLAAGNALDGVRGVLRVHSADPAVPGYVSGTFYGLYSQKYYSFTQSPRGQTEKVDFGAGMISLGYTPTPFVELAVRGVVEGQWVDAYVIGDTGYELGIADVALDVKTLLTPATRKDWMLGAEITLAAPTGNENALVGTWNREGLDLGGRLNVTYAHLDPSGRSRLRAHLNTGYVKRTTEFDATAWAATAVGGTVPRSVAYGDQFLYGTALEVPVPHGFTAFAEWSGEYDLDADASFSDNPMRVTPGLRWSSKSGSLVWTTGYELSVASDEASPPWQWVAGLTLGGFAAPVQGGLLGVVRDAETGEAIEGCEVRVRNGEGEPAKSDASGRFSTEVPEGYAVLELSAEGYEPKTRVIEMAAHERVEFDFTMNKREMFGGLKGRVRDGATGSPLAARVRLAGTEEWVPTDAATGSYYIERVPEGTAEIEIEATSYVGNVSSAKIVAGDIAALDVALHADPGAHRGRLSGVVRNARGESVPATVTVIGKETLTAPVDPATGRYEVELEEGAWNVSVAGAGYASAARPVTIAPRAAVVQDFELAAVPKKITLAGVLFDSGAATIKRESLSALEEAAKFLTENPDVAVVVEGHTDGSGPAEENVALSQRRADAVLKYLVVNFGVDPTRLSAKGYGSVEPLVPNDTEDGRAKNRRIELRIVEKKPE